MSDFKFDCPKCGQSIVCDTSNAGMQIPCPVCQAVMTVPKPPAPSAPAAPAGPAKLSINKAAHAPAKPSPAAGAPAQQGAWSPHAQTATAFQKSRRKGTPKWALALIWVVVALVAAGGGWYGYKQYAAKKAQEKAEKDAADKLAAEAAAKQAAEDAAKARAMRAGWRLDAEDADFPDRPASGKIHGADFKVEEVIFQNNVLILRQTSGSAKQFLIYLPLKSGEALVGKSFSVNATNSLKQPQIVMNWKDDSTGKPGVQSYTKGYGMKLEFEEAVAGQVPAKVYLSVPDPEQSFVAGNFEIAPKNVAGQPTMGQPTMGQPQQGQQRMKRPRPT